MAWTIGLISNTVTISEACEQELQQFADNLSLDSMVLEGKLFFDRDHYEHMDYLKNPPVLETLAKHKVNGEITFGSLEGDNSGRFWGYRFQDGKLTKLVGEVVFTPQL